MKQTKTNKNLKSSDNNTNKNESIHFERNHSLFQSNTLPNKFKIQNNNINHQKQQQIKNYQITTTTPPPPHPPHPQQIMNGGALPPFPPYPYQTQLQQKQNRKQNSSDNISSLF
jgi:hypothetical protein